MPHIDEPITPAPKAKTKSDTPTKAPPAVYSFTIDTADGRVVMPPSGNSASPAPRW